MKKTINEAQLRKAIRKALMERFDRNAEAKDFNELREFLMAYAYVTPEYLQSRGFRVAKMIQYTSRLMDNAMPFIEKYASEYAQSLREHSESLKIYFNHLKDDWDKITYNTYSNYLDMLRQVAVEVQYIGKVADTDTYYEHGEQYGDVNPDGSYKYYQKHEDNFNGELNEGKLGSAALGILMSLGLLSCNTMPEPNGPSDNQPEVTVTSDEDNSKATRQCPTAEYTNSIFDNFDGEETISADGTRTKVKEETTSDGGRKKTTMTIDKAGNINISVESSSPCCCRNNGTCAINETKIRRMIRQTLKQMMK